MQKPLQTADLIALLARVAKQDRNAFSALYAATSAKLYGVVWRILPRKDRAEDVLQDVYVKIWNRAASFDPAKASPITWMATIARNRAIDEVRRRAPLSIEDAPQALDVPAEGLNPLDAAQQSAELQRLQDCLQGIGSPSGARSCCSPTTPASAAMRSPSGSGIRWERSRSGCTAAWRNLESVSVHERS